MNYRTYFRDSVYPSFRDPFFADHLARYRFVSPKVQGLKVLEIGCGKGYGSRLLAESAREVVALDLNPESLAFAREHYRKSNLKFLEHEMTERSAAELGTFDAAVSFEVIEHIPPAEAGRFISNLKSLVRPGGKVFLSTPNHEVVTKAGVEVPEFHINNLTSREFRSALLSTFKDVQIYGQFRKRSLAYRTMLFLDRWNLRHTLKIRRRLSAPETVKPERENFDFLNDPPWSPEAGFGPADRFVFSKWIVHQAGMVVAEAET